MYQLIPAVFSIKAMSESYPTCTIGCHITNTTQTTPITETMQNQIKGYNPHTFGHDFHSKLIFFMCKIIFYSGSLSVELPLFSLIASILLLYFTYLVIINIDTQMDTINTIIQMHIINVLKGII